MRDLTDVASFRSRLQRFQRPVHHEVAGRVPPKSSACVSPITTWQPPTEDHKQDKREVVRSEVEDLTPRELPATEASLVVASTLNGQSCELPQPKTQPRKPVRVPVGQRVANFFHRLTAPLYTLIDTTPVHWYTTPQPILKRNRYTVKTWYATT